MNPPSVWMVITLALEAPPPRVRPLRGAGHREVAGPEGVPREPGPAHRGPAQARLRHPRLRLRLEAGPLRHPPALPRLLPRVRPEPVRVGRRVRRRGRDRRPARHRGTLRPVRQHQQQLAPVLLPAGRQADRPPDDQPPLAGRPRRRHLRRHRPLGHLARGDADGGAGATPSPGRSWPSSTRRKPASPSSRRS